MLTPPLAFFLLVYLASLVVLLITAFWQVNGFTNAIEHVFTFANIQQLWQTPAYLHIALRTLGIAIAVTVTDAMLAFPLAYFMARIATSRVRSLMFMGVLLPLWASYIARVYAWMLILSHDGVLNWTLAKFGLGPQNFIYTNVATWIVFSYVWLPFMVLPIFASLEKIPQNYLEASADLGGHGLRTLRSVIWPLALPGVVAGSIFTFSLTLGDYITPVLVGGPQMLGQVVYQSFGISGNVPGGAAIALIPVAIMAVYLFLAKRLGAFDAL